MESFFSNLFYQHSGNFCEPVTEPMLVSKVTCVLLLVNMAFTGVIACLRFFFFLCYCSRLNSSRTDKIDNYAAV